MSVNCLPCPVVDYSQIFNVESLNGMVTSIIIQLHVGL